MSSPREVTCPGCGTVDTLSQCQYYIYCQNRECQYEKPLIFEAHPGTKWIKYKSEFEPTSDDYACCSKDAMYYKDTENGETYAIGSMVVEILCGQEVFTAVRACNIIKEHMQHQIRQMETLMNAMNNMVTRWEQPLLYNPEQNGKHNASLPIFQPALFQVLPQALKLLDPKSLVRMAWTCREFYNLCLQSGKVVVEFKLDISCLEMTRDFNGENERELQWQDNHKDPILEQFKNIPCVVEIGTLWIQGIEANDIMWDLVEHRFKKFNVSKLGFLWFDNVSDVTCWPKIYTFMQKYGVKSIRSMVDEDLPPQTVTTLLNMKLNFVALHQRLPEDYVIQTDIARLTIEGNNLGLLETSIKGWLEKDCLKMWKFTHHRAEFPVLYESFDRLPFDFPCTLSEERPLFFEKREENSMELIVVRKDNKLVKIHTEKKPGIAGIIFGNTSIHFIEPKDAPPCLQHIDTALSDK